MDRTLMREIYRLFEDEFDVNAFESNDGESMLQLLLIYKHKLGLNFISPAGEHITFKWRCDMNSGDTNGIILGGAPIEDGVLDELTTGFVNNQIATENEDEEYRIYSCEEKQLVQITKVDSAVSNAMIYGYGTRQLFMSLVTKLLPWHFQLNEEQMKVVRDIASKIIQDNGLSQIENIFEDIMSEHGMIAKVQEKKLAKMGERILERRTSYIRNELDNNEAQYDRLYSQLMDYGARIRENRIQLAAIENSNGEFENPIKEMQQFMADCAHEFKLARVDGNEIYLECKMPLVDYTDEEYYRASIKEGTRSSAFIRYFDNYAEYDEDTIREAYKHIMETRDCTVWTCCQIVIDMYDYELTVRNEISREHAMKHPHLNTSLRCFGTASESILGYLRKARMYEAMNQVAFAAQQFTMDDSWARDVFIEGIDKVECIECPDGEFRNFRQLMDAIKEGIL